MFALFFSLYLAMFRGRWTDFSSGDIYYLIKTPINKVGELVTSLFNNVSTPVTDFGDVFTASSSYAGQTIPNYISLVCLVLALITSIGIVVVAVKGIKRIFAVFFTFGR